ncbi:alpha/beta hydrolase [Isoalcanivorax beigongshangi]|uniref:Alpha/beta hydrolase n=1 Tax=Isoalcanivorax beigongshangi TaxID=3238810 RepID=A0ABV4AKM4_9GAMM
MASLLPLMRGVLLAGALLASGCSSLLFYPMSPWVQNPARQGLDYQDVVLIHADGLRLHSWWLPAATDEVAGTVLFLHGNAQNISTHLMGVAWMPAAGYEVLLLDYRGYGLSEGRPRLPDVLDDIQLALDWLQSRRRSDAPLVVFGQSLGAAMGSAVLARPDNRDKYDCVMLEGGFANYQDISRDIMSKSWLLRPFGPFVRAGLPRDLQPEQQVGALAPTPLLILHSLDDSIVPFAHGERLAAAAGEGSEFQRLRGEHISAGRDPAVQARLATFMQGACRH